jgi:hypothetical protein
MPPIPSEWALSVTHKASEFVAQQCLAYIYDFPPVPIPEIDLLTYMACCQLARVLAAAYMNPSKCWYLPCLWILTGRHCAVHLPIDLIRYNEALDKNASGQNERHESSLLERFPPVDMHVDKPSVFIDAGGRIIMWYLPGAISNLIRVSLSLQSLLTSSQVYRTTCMPPQLAWETFCGKA